MTEYRSGARAVVPDDVRALGIFGRAALGSLRSTERVLVADTGGLRAPGVPGGQRRSGYAAAGPGRP